MKLEFPEKRNKAEVFEEIVIDKFQKIVKDNKSQI